MSLKSIKYSESWCSYSKARAVFAKLVGVAVWFILASSFIQQSVANEESLSVDELGYKVRPEGESEFDNQSGAYVKDWRTAIPRDDYEDTEFGELIYNEASTPSKLEILRLISKETPSMLVFLTAMSMGLDIETVLQASVQYEPQRSRDFAAAAVNILPAIPGSNNYVYSSYELDDLDREDDSKPYSVQQVVDRFFQDRLILRPYPDWFDGQYHFMASAAELSKIQQPKKQFRWYRTKSTEVTENRPIFISLYEATESVLVDSEERIKKALEKDPDALLPVVFVFNRLNERAIDQLGYPMTIRGLQSAYADKNLMVTPAPEWQLGEYHFYAQMSEVYEIFDIPEEEDFEPETWQKLLEEAEDYTVTNTAFIMVVVGSNDEDSDTADARLLEGEQYAAWDNPRTEEAFPYSTSKDSPPVTLENVMGKGLVFNRPDLMAALSALGVDTVPIAFYYIDKTRVKPFLNTPRSLIQAAVGAGAPISTFGGGGTPPPPKPPTCASPPCTQ